MLEFGSSRQDIVRRRGLVISAAHLCALMKHPVAYLRAMFWRILGKRLRARSQMTPLLGDTPYAYALWQMREDGDGASAPGGSPPIIGLVVEWGNCDPGVAETLKGLSAEDVPAFVVNPDDPDALLRVAEAIDWRNEPWLMVIRGGDQMAPGFADTYRSAIAQADVCVAYADDDIIDHRASRRAPHFKPDWNAELFRCHDYLSGACICRLDKQELQDLASDADWPRQLVARGVAKGGVVHLRRILHHRRARPVPDGLPSPTIPANLPLVSIVIPTRNRVDLLRTCIAGVRRTNYPITEIIVVDNDSDDPETLTYLSEQEATGARILRYAGEFNYSAINNYAVAHARGELLCLLNNDIEVLSPDWLPIMATQALRPDVGAVGAQLLYPDGRIQHAGVVIGMGNAAGHAHRFLRPEDEGYFRRHALPQFISAVTAACLVVAKERFLAVGGLDEENFKVAFNDVDLCLRLNQRGWQSLYEPRAVLVHHESVSRGFDRDPVGAARFAGELAALQRIWRTDVVHDPFHHPELSRATEQFALAL
jgi:GT2 family glycosyltransferase